MIAVPFLLCGIGILFAMCAACFYRMGAADRAHEKKFLIDSLESLESENAKLRELALMLANCAAGHGCDYCPINGGQGYVGEIDMCESVHDRMRELGVIE